MRKKIPPKFNQDVLKKILHYTDLAINPSYDAMDSKCFYRLYCGAKGVSKSFGRAIETIYRFVNEINFCSCWCRNQYNHIKTTLRPMFEKAFNFLCDEYDLDFKPFIKIYESGIYWDYKDGGDGRAIYFQNWEKIQAFQGFTLSNPKFRFGELVIDEPIEDPIETRLKTYQLDQLYETQEKKLPLLIQNTINREPSNDPIFVAKKNVTFCYNLFTTKHFIVKNYHNKFLNIVQNGKLNENTLNKLLEKTYLQHIEKNAFNDFGICITMFSKFFIPKNQIDDQQKRYFLQLKESDYRLWMITVAGFAFEEISTDEEYFLKDYILDENGELKERLFVTDEFILNKLANKEFIYIFDGFDPGKSDKAAWVRIGIDNELKIYVLNIVEDLRNNGKIKSRELTKLNLINCIQNSNAMLEIEKNVSNHENIIFCDNDIEIEWINKDLQAFDFNGVATLATRKDTNVDKFGIINRQKWQKFIFSKKLIYFLYGTEKLLKNLAEQIITNMHDGKRDETINPKIYDLINAFEMACSQAYKIQLLNLGE